MAFLNVPVLRLDSMNVAGRWKGHKGNVMKHVRLIYTNVTEGELILPFWQWPLSFAILTLPAIKDNSEGWHA